MMSQATNGVESVQAFT